MSHGCRQERSPPHWLSSSIFGSICIQLCVQRNLTACEPDATQFPICLLFFKNRAAQTLSPSHSASHQTWSSDWEGWHLDISVSYRYFSLQRHCEWTEMCSCGAKYNMLNISEILSQSPCGCWVGYAPHNIHSDEAHLSRLTIIFWQISLNLISSQVVSTF